MFITRDLKILACSLVYICYIRGKFKYNRRMTRTDNCLVT